METYALGGKGLMFFFRLMSTFFWIFFASVLKRESITAYLLLSNEADNVIKKFPYNSIFFLDRLIARRNIYLNLFHL